MEIEHVKNYEQISTRTGELVLAELIRKKDILLCASTGSSPTGTYEQLRQHNKINPSLFAALKVIKLDEWGGIPPDDPGTCEYYLKKNLIAPMGISPDRYISFSCNPPDPEAECRRIRLALEETGGIDVCILGLGMNGHIALNEPAGFLQPFCHVAQLSGMTLKHPMATGMNKKPSYGLTLGMAEILASKKIIMIVHGRNKEKAAGELFSGRISTQVPASFLWLHPDTVCISDIQTV